MARVISSPRHFSRSQRNFLASQVNGNALIPSRLRDICKLFMKEFGCKVKPLAVSRLFLKGRTNGGGQGPGTKRRSVRSTFRV